MVNRRETFSASRSGNGASMPDTRLNSGVGYADIVRSDETESPLEIVQGIFDATQLPPEVREVSQTRLREAVTLNAKQVLGGELEPYKDEALRRVLKIVFPDTVDDVLQAERENANLSHYMTSGGNVRGMSPGFKVDDERLAEAMIRIVRDIMTNDPQLDKVMNTRFDYDFVYEGMKRLARQTTFYRALLSFDASGEVLGYRSLNSHEWQVRAAQIEESVRSVHGMLPGEDLRRNPDARRALARAVFRLDDETVRDPSNVTNNDRRKFDKALDIFEKYLDPQQKQFARIIRKNSGLTEWSDDDVEAYTKLYARWRQAASTATDNVSDEQLIGVPVEYRRALGYMMCVFTIKYYGVGISEYANNGRGYRGFLAEIDKMKELFHQPQRDRYRHVVASRMAACLGGACFDSHNDTITGFIHTYPEPKKGELGRLVDGPRDASREAICHDLSPNKYRCIGEVLKFVLPPGVRNGLRFLTPVIGSHHDGVESADANDVVIDMGRQLDAAELDGFTITALSTDGKSYMKYDHERHDPDDYCFVPVDDDKLNSLIAKLNDAGLGSLADTLAASYPLTVAELEVVLSSQMRYVTEPREGVILEDLRDCHRLVGEDGLLEVQCTGANAILELMMIELFGEGKTKQVSGTAINASSKIVPSIGHQKVAFVYNDTLYYLDATPPLASDEVVDAPGRVSLKELKSIKLNRHKIGKNADEDVAGVNKDNIVVVQENTVMSNEERTARLDDIYENDLMNLISMQTGLPRGNKDDLTGYKQVNGQWGWHSGARGIMLQSLLDRGNGDPLRHAASLIARARGGRVEAEEITLYIKTLQGLIDMSDRERVQNGKKFGVNMSFYNTAGLSLIVDILEKTRDSLGSSRGLS